MRRLVAILGALVLVGCESDDTGGNTQTAFDAQTRGERMIDDAGPETDAGAPREDGEVEADAAVEADAEVEPDAEEPLIRDLPDCAAICRVYESCGELEAFWDGDADACLQACTDAEPSPRFGNFRSCMQITPCDRLAECPVPPKPLPSCAQVCEAAAGCEAEFRVPRGDCAAECEDDGAARLIQQCGVELVEAEPAACDEPAFAVCLLEQRAAECLAVCRQRAMCDEAIDLVDCTLDCDAAEAPEDPVAQRRFEQGRACLLAAEDCDAVAACEQRQLREIVGEASVEDLCAANAECPFFDPETCADEVEPLLRSLADGAVDCFTEHLSERCGEPPFACFRPAPAPENACLEHCVVSNLCGLLPEGQSEFECTERCQADLASGDPARTEPLRPLFACAFSGTCDELATCQAEADADATCREACGRQIECGGEEVDGACVDHCVERFNTARMRAEAACVNAAGACEAVQLCQPPPPPDCDAYCGPLDACGAADAACARRCDDDEFADPEGFLERLACINGVARCNERLACEDGELGPAAACLAWCQLELSCGDEPPTRAERAACITACSGDLGGQQGLVFEVARPCLAENGPEAECGVLQACVDDIEFRDFCQPWCDELARCRIDEDTEACMETCMAPGNNAPLFERASCTLTAARRGEGCGRVAECEGVEVEPASPDCQALCGARNACAPDDVDAFLCERECIPEPEGTPVRAACAERGGCASIDACVEADGVVPDACATTCVAVGECDGLVGEDGLFADGAACEVECAGAAIVEGEQYPGALEQCVAQSNCDAMRVEQCFVEPDTICQEAWDALVACGAQDFPPPIGGGGDEMAFLVACQNQLVNDPVNGRAPYECARDTGAGGDPFQCLAIVLCGLNF